VFSAEKRGRRATCAPNKVQSKKLSMTPNFEQKSSAPVDIAFITVNYNTLGYVKQLASFFAELDVPFTFSFTAVDNDSKDGSQEFLRAASGVHYLQTAGNVGYGRAINRGVAATQSKYICVTNTDVILNKETLVALWRFLETRHEVGVCAPRITYEDGREQGMLFHPSLFSHYAHWYAKTLARHAKQQLAKARQPVQVDGVTGAFFFIRRSLISSAALFDEDFFFFHEDTALAHSLRNRGVKCFILPHVRIVHIGGQSRSEDSAESFYDTKYLYLKKFYGPFHARAVYFVDRARISRKRIFYSLIAPLIPSERIKSKERYYKAAWNTIRPK
jgi:N-acetylglucosaminyl-diphospho-decaprenol L-rhamnosyltransferase